MLALLVHWWKEDGRTIRMDKRGAKKRCRRNGIWVCLRAIAHRKFSYKRDIYIYIYIYIRDNRSRSTFARKLPRTDRKKITLLLFDEQIETLLRYSNRSKKNFILEFPVRKFRDISPVRKSFTIMMIDSSIERKRHSWPTVFQSLAWRFDQKITSLSPLLVSFCSFFFFFFSFFFFVS